MTRVPRKVGSKFEWIILLAVSTRHVWIKALLSRLARGFWRQHSTSLQSAGFLNGNHEVCCDAVRLVNGDSVIDGFILPIRVHGHDAQVNRAMLVAVSAVKQFWWWGW